MTDSKDIKVEAADAGALGAGFAVVPADPDAPLAGQPSSSDDNVGRARRRRDRDSPEVLAEAHRILAAELAAQSRIPFRKVLAELIGARPTPEAIRRFADKHPDRWAQAVSIIAGLGGYERGMIEVNVLNVKNLSDSALEQRLAEVERDMQKLAAGASRVSQGPVEDAVVVSAASGCPASPEGAPSG